MSQPPLAPQPANLRLLIVSESSLDVELIIKRLHKAVAAVTYDVAATSAACQKLLQEQSYDAVLLDISLEEMSMEILKLLQQSKQEIPLNLFNSCLEDKAGVNYLKAKTNQIHRLERIADQTAIALYNAQTYKRLEQQVRERTQELEEEKQLSKIANRTKNEFIATMSHELRTPLTCILGFSRLLLDQVFGRLNQKQQEYLTAISSSGNHLLELINDVLDLSKIEAGQEELTLETLLVEEICLDAVKLVRERAQKKGLQILVYIAPNITTCIADNHRLEQILVNLLSNAVKFTETGLVTLNVEKTADTILFSVIDTGIGISEAQQTILFEAFQQLDSGLNRQYEGTGLGLALCRKLALLHGGEITVKSKLLSGSCFTLHLPIQPQDSSKTAQNSLP